MATELSTAKSNADDIPLSLYVHFPWCVQKCPYCDFNSHSLRSNELPEDAYISALLKDLTLETTHFEKLATREIKTVFMGGGTPSLFSGKAMRRFINGAREQLNFSAHAEITLEANPGTVDEANFAEYFSAGINRLSIGIQSLDAAQLKKLGRIHDPAQAMRAVNVARAAGFNNINLDMMFALPQQTLAEAKSDLEQLIALEPEHISYYHLTLEPNTAFAANPPPLPDGDLASDIHQQGQELLAGHGYAQYETSAYARSGKPSQHNLNYWQFGDYIGIGAGAHGKLSTRESSNKLNISRRARHKLPKTFSANAGNESVIQEQVIVADKDLPFEFAMNALRLKEGVASKLFTQRCGISLDNLERVAAPLRQRGLLVADTSRFQTTEMGFAHLNSVLEHFLL